MPLYRKSLLTPNTTLGIWEIEEDPETLKSDLLLSPEDEHFYQTLRSDLRKKHWLSYRNILSEIVGKEEAMLRYDEHGKPEPLNHKYHLSATHSGIFSAVIVSYEEPVGIDIEAVKNRIEKVKDKFLSEKELTDIGTRNRLEKLYIYWGAKESIYKLNGKTGINFGLDIIVEPFDFSDNEKGTCIVRMTKAGEIKNFFVFYEKIEGYMLVYTLPQGITL